MTLKLPEEFYADLTDERLSCIARALLDVRRMTLDEMQSELDDNYTRECAVVGRQRNVLISMARGGQYEWLSLKHAGMDVTFSIGSVPCRFFTDDPNSPRKDGFFKRNATDDLFATDDQVPVMWRFVVLPALTDQDEDRAFLIGFNAFQEKISEWEYRPLPAVLHSVNKGTPPAVELSPLSVELKDPAEEVQDKGQDENKKDGTGSPGTSK